MTIELESIHPDNTVKLIPNSRNLPEISAAYHNNQLPPTPLKLVYSNDIRYASTTMRLIYKTFYIDITDQLGFHLIAPANDPSRFDVTIAEFPNTTLQAVIDAIKQQLILESI